MDLARFNALLAADRPPAGMAPPVEALWWQAKGDWNRSHSVAQKHDDPACAWIHAYLHRVEGDLSNAAHWYRRAGREVATGSLEAEREAIIATLT